MTFISIIKRLGQDLRAYRREVLFVVLLGIATAGFNLFVPQIAKWAIDWIVATIRTDQPAQYTFIIVLMVLLVASTMIQSVMTGQYTHVSFRLATYIEDRWRFRVLRKFLGFAQQWHDDQDSGELASKIDRGASGIFDLISEIFAQNVLLPFITLVAILVYTFTVAPLVGIIIVLPIPFFLWATHFYANVLSAAQKHINELWEKSYDMFYDVTGNVRTIKIFNRDEHEVNTYAATQRAAHTQEYISDRKWQSLGNAQATITVIGRALLLGYLAYAAVEGSLSLGSVVLFTSYQAQAYQPLQQLASTFTRVRRIITRIERLFGIYDTNAQLLEHDDAITLQPIRHSIAFHDVSFGYGQKRVLEHVHLIVQAGETVALIGRSGSGKTTLMTLLARLYDTTEGTILLDGKDVRSISEYSLREQLSIVSQDVVLFNRSIAENIAYGFPNATMEQIVAAAKLANADEFIIATPKGYESVVGERGVKLSGGQRQRIGIARAAIRNASVLIMDEATSHLDTESERLIQDATEKLQKGKTTFIIAHRLSTIIHADMIVVMDQGKIVATGTHQELLKTSSLYRHLYELQFEE